MRPDIKIYPRKQVCQMLNGYFDPEINHTWFLISIYTEPDEELIGYEAAQNRLKELGCEDTLSLRFWDITEEGLAGTSMVYHDVALFDEDQAQEIISFLDKTFSSVYKKLTYVVHCDAGVSRSGAVGVFICDYVDWHFQEKSNMYETLKEEHPHIHPNQHVLRTLKKVAGMLPEE